MGRSFCGSIDFVDNVTRTSVGDAVDFTSGSAGLSEDGIGDHSRPTTASINKADAEVSVECSEVAAGTVFVPVVVGSAAGSPSGAAGVLALNLLQDSSDIFDSGGLTIGELADGFFNLALAIVISLIVLVTGIVLVNESEHADDDGASLGTGHGLGALEVAVVHTGDNAAVVAVGNSSSVGAGRSPCIRQNANDAGRLGSSGRVAVLGKNVVQGDSHLIAGHGVLVDGSQAGGNAYLLSSFGVCPVPFMTGSDFLVGFNVAVVEGTGQHDQELNAGDLVFRLELAVLEALHDAELGALHDVGVVPIAGLDIGELGNEGGDVVDALIGAGVVPIAVVGSERSGAQGHAHNECENQRSNLLHGFIPFLS